MNINYHTNSEKSFWKFGARTWSGICTSQNPNEISLKDDRKSVIRCKERASLSTLVFHSTTPRREHRTTSTTTTQPRNPPVTEAAAPSSQVGRQAGRVSGVQMKHRSREWSDSLLRSMNVIFYEFMCEMKDKRSLHLKQRDKIRTHNSEVGAKRAQHNHRKM